VSPTAIVFAYHDVGCRCLSVLLARGVRVPLVVTHRDNPGENIWFASVERLAREAGLEVATPDDPGEPASSRGWRASRLTSSSPSTTGLCCRPRCWPPPAAAPSPARLAPAEVPGPRAGQLGDHPRERETGATLHENGEKPTPGASSAGRACRSATTTPRSRSSGA